MHNLAQDFFNHTPFMAWAAICLTALGIERAYHKNQKQTLRGNILNMSTGFITCVSMFVMTPLASILVYSFGNRFGLGLIDLRFFPHLDFVSQLASALMIMFIEDFFYYFYHRAAHTIPFLWDIHAVHHSETELNVTATLRRHWLETPLQEILVTIPIMLLFRLTPIEMTVVAFGRAAFVFFAHMNIRLQMGRYSWLLTSPQLHRLHHSCLPEHWDSNYTQVFPVIDKIFGTYVAPKRDEFPPTGLAADERIETMSDMLLWPFKKWAQRAKGSLKIPTASSGSK